MRYGLWFFDRELGARRFLAGVKAGQPVWTTERSQALGLASYELATAVKTTLAAALSIHVKPTPLGA